MRKSTKKDFVQKMLDLVFSTVRHSDQTEREVSTTRHCVIHLFMMFLFPDLTYPEYISDFLNFMLVSMFRSVKVLRFMYYLLLAKFRIHNALGLQVIV